jgi:hypothetical protein
VNTEHLVRALAADHATRQSSLAAKLAGATIAGLAVSAVLYALILGPRPDLAAAIESPRFVFKLVLMLIVGALAALLVVRLARPEASAKMLSLVLVLAGALLLGAVLVELAVTPQALWLTRLVGSSAILCLQSIPLLALPVLLMSLAILRSGATTRPSTTGAVAGLFAGALGALLYGTHCPDDSPLFVAAWYSIAIAIVAIVGLLASRRALRW